MQSMLKKQKTMKTIFTLITLFLFTNAFSQSGGQLSEQEVLETLELNACDCIDKIGADMQTNEAITRSINACIEQEYVVYFIAKEMKVRGIKAKDLKKKKSKAFIQEAINFDRESHAFQEFYLEMERALMDNCRAMKSKVASDNTILEYSFSENEEAMDWYNKGIIEDRNSDFEEAIISYQKALAIDSVFTFAWDNLGLAYRRTEQFEKAVDAYKKSIEINPNGIMPWQNLAVAYQYLEDYEKALETYEHIASMDSLNPESYYGMGVIYTFYVTNYEKALHNICIAYRIYLDKKSPYRTDAEKMLSTIFRKMSQDGQEERFHEILSEHNMQMK